MKKRYQAAIQGQGGIFSALRSAWSSRFHAIRAFVMVPEENERLELSVSYSVKLETDIVKLTRTNWQTGKTSVLYNGALTNGVHNSPRQLKD